VDKVNFQTHFKTCIFHFCQLKFVMRWNRAIFQPRFCRAVPDFVSGTALCFPDYLH
jgi:hypothetical protein